MLASKENKEEIKRKFDCFMEEYGSLMSPSLFMGIMSFFWENVYEREATDILMEIYEYLGLVHPKGNFYQKHFENIKERFDLSGNILEIGGGCIPSFAEKIAKEQIKCGEGTITIYDKEILLKESRYPNMTLVKEKFTSKTEIKNFDLVIGILPCTATELMLSRACEENKNFYVALCNCSHLLNGKVVSKKRFKKYILKMIYEKLALEKEQLEITKLGKGFKRFKNSPILIHRKKEQEMIN